MGSDARNPNCLRTLTLNINDAFPGKYFKASDVAEPKTMTITGVGMEQLQDGTQKPAVYFSESQQAFVLNKTNANFMSQAFGAQTEAGLASKSSSTRIRLHSKDAWLTAFVSRRRVDLLLRLRQRQSTLTTFLSNLLHSSPLPSAPCGSGSLPSGDNLCLDYLPTKSFVMSPSLPSVSCAAARI